MKDRLLNVATVLSLLSCAAVATVWVRSYYAFEAIDVTVSGRSFSLGAPAGRVWVVYDAEAPLYRIRRDPKPVFGIDDYAAGWTGARQAAGFTWVSTRTLTAMLVPLWAVLFATLVVPAAWLWRRRPRGPGGRGFPVRPNGGD